MMMHVLTARRLRHSRWLRMAIGATLALGAGESSAQLCVQLNGAFYTQSFNTLAASGSSNNSSSVPIGFAFSEAGSGNNVTYAAGDGSSSTGNTYSFGTGTNVDRAFGELGSVVQTTCGACFVNNTGLVVTSFSVSYTGEQWRLGAADALSDRLDFQFSTTATSLTTGTYTDVNSLDFVSPTNSGAVGAKDGNAAANRTTFSPIAIIPPAGIPHGSTFFIRWVPSNIAGANDGLAIDDFRLSSNPSADFDQDSDVDGADFLRWQRGLGTKSGASISVGDANRDGAVDVLDLTIWRQFAFGPPFAATVAASSTPEPATGMLVLAAMAALSVRRRLPRRCAGRRERQLVLHVEAAAVAELT